jgi:nucleoside 2-deoxyribosyltransferase
MKIYLAAGSNYINYIIAQRAAYHRAGFMITSSWLDGLSDQEQWDRCAERDLNDVDAADVLIIYTASDSSITAGRHVELGYALARNKIIILIGPAENIFHYHNRVIWCKDTDHAIMTLRMLPNERGKHESPSGKMLE